MYKYLIIDALFPAKFIKRHELAGIDALEVQAGGTSTGLAPKSSSSGRKRSGIFPRSLGSSPIHFWHRRGHPHRFIFSTAVLRIRIRRIHVFGPPGSGFISQRYGSGSFFHQAKIVRKTLIPTVSWLHYDFQKVISKKTFLIKLVFILSMTKIAGSGSISQRYGSLDPHPDPDLLQNFMDPQHCSIDFSHPPPPPLVGPIFVRF